MSTQLIVLNKIQKLSLRDEELGKFLEVYLTKLTVGICSVDLLLNICMENKLWSSQIRVIALLVDKHGQAIQKPAQSQNPS